MIKNEEDLDQYKLNQNNMNSKWNNKNLKLRTQPKSPSSIINPDLDLKDYRDILRGQRKGNKKG
mgnify:CR=1 FL=1